MIEEESFDDLIDNKEFFADFDLDDISALEEGDLSLLSDPQRIRQLAEALAITPPDPGMGPNESENGSGEQSQQAMPPPLPPVVISPAEIDNITIQLEKNQQCACRDCGKLFNSVWYLKQHAVKHSNDRPFKCKFCMKTYKFRSNLYQHKCPERNRHMGTVGPTYKKKFYTRGIAYTEMYQKGGPDGEGEINPTKGRPSKVRTKELYDHKDGIKQNDVQNCGMAMSQTQLGGQMIGSTMLSNFDDSDQQSGVSLNPNGFEISSHYSIMSGSSDNNSQQMFFDNTFGGQQNTVVNSEMNNTEGNSEQPGGPNCFDQFGAYDPSAFGQQSSQYGADYCNSVREKPLSQEYIDAYIQKNRHRVYSCRKCKLVFPSREYLSRHNAYHTSLDSQPFACDQCPQRFSTEKQLSNHFLQHSDNSPHRCLQCYGTFRSALALRRHKDQCRQCYYPPFGVQPRLMVSPSAPLDQYAFVESEDELDNTHHAQTISEEHLNDIFVPGDLVGMQRKGTVDSGVGSDCSHSFASSPIRQISYEDSSALMQPPSYPMMAPEFVGPSSLSSLKPDSGFRSRLNSLATSTSTTQSCSPPGSSVSSGSDGGSPHHRHKASPPTGTDQMHYAASIDEHNECVVMEDVDGGVCRTMAQQRKKDWLKTRFTSKDMMMEKKSRLDRLQQWSSSWESEYDERYSSSTESYYNLSDRDDFSDDATSYTRESKVDEEHAENMEEGVVREAVQLRLMFVIVNALVETSRKNKDKAGQQQPNSVSLGVGLAPDLGVASASSTDPAVIAVDNNSDVSNSLNTENA
ncbi:zinc finger protein [Ditylenchus destructor]|uniref:Zinc finger protein n=1 Tax=Ditylenchus destructor TaxID=166010 RepID=A0AAD4N9B7_9BILA|nr:zinc finger protein [Ditylenchus destructor]